MQAQIEIPPSVLTEAMEKSLFKGELGEKVAAQLANLYAEITTYNRSDAAKLLNVGRSTIYEYEAKGLIEFRPDNRISLAALLEFQRGIARTEREESDEKTSVGRKSHKPKRRTFK